MQPSTLHALLATLLFLPMAGLRRPWDLRGYGGTLLPLLTGQTVAYGYEHVRRVLALLAQADADQALRTMVAQWTTHLWHPDHLGWLIPGVIYVDSHKKAVHSDVLIPRGRIGKTGKIQGCRTLVLIHDAAGHPLFVTTDRGDQHLIRGLPTAVAAFETASGSTLRTIIVDREGMGGDFLAAMVADGRVVVTILRATQYTGLESFHHVEPFAPLDVAPDGRILREVARAQFDLTVPSQPDQPLRLNVALIRDHRVARPTTDTVVVLDDDWMDADWTPAWTAPTTEPRLIPIVTTGALGDPRQLVALYQGRWPQQENVIRDWLIPLQIEVNAGCAKTPVVNSEAQARYDRCAARADRLADQAACAQRTVATQQTALATAQAHATRVEDLLPLVCAEERAAAQAVLDCHHAAVATAQERVAQAQAALSARRQAQQAVAQDQIAVATAPPMFELDNRQDAIMNSLKVCAANLGMWTRDAYFPASMGRATWTRLRPFLELAGQIQHDPAATVVTLEPFNDRARNAELAALCAQVATRRPQLPDGSQLVFRIAPGGERPPRQPLPWTGPPPLAQGPGEPWMG